jgi:sulfite reductase alpha subunit-like flavoprotein
MSLQVESTAGGSPTPPVAWLQSRRIIILYGSQTGTAQELAETLTRQANLHYFMPQLCAMDDYPISSLPTESLVIFIASTTGQGEQPDNMKKFWKFLLQRQLNNSNALSNIKFATFGLGDSSYPMFNAVIRKLEVRLLQLGGQEIVERGLGDDQAQLGYAAEFDSWAQKLWNTLLEIYPLLPGLAVKQQAVPIPAYKVEIISHERSENNSEIIKYNSADTENKGQIMKSTSETAKYDSAEGSTAPESKEFTSFQPKHLFQSGCTPYTPFPAPVRMNKRISSADCEQEIRHIELDISGSGLNYEPGDVALVHPHNNPAMISQFITNYLKFHPLDVVKFTPNRLITANDRLLPSECTLQQLFELYLAILSSPRRYFFQVAQFFSENNEREKEKLQDFASNEGQMDLYKYSNREARSYIEVLAEFPSVSLPLHIFIDILPRLQPRSFSISSALSPNSLEITLAVLEFTTPLKRRRVGVVSHYLQQLDTCKSGQRNVVVANNTTNQAVIQHTNNENSAVATVLVWIARGSFRFPANCAAPIIMCGPGTGIAPFRAMCMQRKLQTRDKLSDTQEKGKFGRISVYFGCRYSAKDHIYKEEFQELLAAGVIQHYHAAFSRDQLNKHYVQHDLLDNSQRVYHDLVVNGGYFMLAGSANQLPKDVKAAIKLILQQQGLMEAAAAEEYLKKMEREKRYIVEVW